MIIYLYIKNLFPLYIYRERDVFTLQFIIQLNKRLKNPMFLQLTCSLLFNFY